MNYKLQMMPRLPGGRNDEFLFRAYANAGRMLMADSRGFVESIGEKVGFCTRFYDKILNLSEFNRYEHHT